MNTLQHRVVQGDRWDSLAWHYYGDPYGFQRIIDANPAVPICQPLVAGTVLLIPVIAREQVTINPEDLPPWKR